MKGNILKSNNHRRDLSRDACLMTERETDMRLGTSRKGDRERFANRVEFEGWRQVAKETMRSHSLVEIGGLSLTSGSGRWTGGNGCQDHWHSATGLAVRHVNKTDVPSSVSVCSGISTNTTGVGGGFVCGITSSMEWPLVSETTVISAILAVSPITLAPTDSSATGIPVYQIRK